MVSTIYTVMCYTLFFWDTLYIFIKVNIFQYLSNFIKDANTGMFPYSGNIRQYL